MRFLLFILSVLCFQTSPNAQDHNILDYGAVPDGVYLNTEKIQRRLMQRIDQGGGRVIIPSGRFLSGSILTQNPALNYICKRMQFYWAAQILHTISS